MKNKLITSHAEIYRHHMSPLTRVATSDRETSNFVILFYFFLKNSCYFFLYYFKC